jgi:hypothetical protein
MIELTIEQAIWILDFFKSSGNDSYKEIIDSIEKQIIEKVKYSDKVSE